MFNIGFAELILILLVAFLVVGPKDLPKVARALGRFIKYLKVKWAEFIQETDLTDTINEIKGVGDDLKLVIKDIDPSGDLKKAQKDLDKNMNEIEQAVKTKKPPVNR